MSQSKNNTKKHGWKHLSERERYAIEALMKMKISVSRIAQQLGRDRRTIQREIARGRTRQVDSEWRELEIYLADVGQRIHEQMSAGKGRSVKIGHNHELASYLEEMIVRKGYSPDAAIGRLKRSEKAEMATICTKTVYNYIDMGLFAGITNADLPVKRNKKKDLHRFIRKVALNNKKGRSIEERDTQIDLRETEGDWEMDCVVGKQGTKECLLVLTERKYATELVFKLTSKTQESVTDALDGLEKRYGKCFSEIFRTITVDNGSEFLDSEKMEQSIYSKNKKRTTIYYAHPYSSWERGSNENQNKLIRRFVPKGTDIGKLSEESVKRIQYWMNHYPRRRFGYQTPSEMSSLNVA